jgi:hypothetical protein
MQHEDPASEEDDMFLQSQETPVQKKEWLCFPI